MDWFNGNVDSNWYDNQNDMSLPDISEFSHINFDYDDKFEFVEADETGVPKIRIKDHDDSEDYFIFILVQTKYDDVEPVIAGYY